MAVFEAESWQIAKGKEKEHKKALRQWFKWVHDHRELFRERKSVRYFGKRSEENTTELQTPTTIAYPAL